MDREAVGSIELKDFTFDGVTDIAVTYGYKFMIYPNSGTAVFGTPHMYQIGGGSTNISTGDFNADGKVDVAVASRSSNSVNILLADTATQNQYHNVRYFSTQRMPLSMVPGNFNGDEKDDLAVGGWPLHYMTILTSLPTLIITARDTTRTYGSPNPQFKSNVKSLRNSDALDITYTTTANIKSHIGEYEIVPKPDNATASNYAVVVENGKLTITPAPLKITAKDTTRMIGEPNPVFEGVIDGLLNEDNVLVSYTTPAKINSPVGEYPIIPHVDWRGEDYEPIYVNGTLTITAVVGVESRYGKSEFNPYPNPSKGIFIVDSMEAQPMEYEIHDCSGRVFLTGVLSHGQNIIKVNPAEGVYILKLSNGVVRKVIIN
jgi:hypothetical protein